MSTEHPENTTQLKSLSKAFDQSHHNLFDNIKVFSMKLQISMFYKYIYILASISSSTG